MLAAGETDLALLRGPVTLPAALRQAPVAGEELGVLMSEHNPLAEASRVDPVALSGRELIMFRRDLSPGFYDEVLRVLRERGAEVSVSDSAMGFQQTLAILPLRQAAVTLASARAAANAGLAWRPFRGEPLMVSYVAAWREGSRGDALIAVLNAISRSLTDVS